MRAQEHNVGVAWRPVKFLILLQFFEILNFIFYYSDPVSPLIQPQSNTQAKIILC